MVKWVSVQDWLDVGCDSVVEGGELRHHLLMFLEELKVRCDL